MVITLTLLVSQSQRSSPSLMNDTFSVLKLSEQLASGLGSIGGGVGGAPLSSGELATVDAKDRSGSSRDGRRRELVDDRREGIASLGRDSSDSVGFILPDGGDSSTATTVSGCRVGRRMKPSR